MTIYSNIRNKLALGIINSSHIAFTSFAILTPFTSNQYYLGLHATAMPFVMLHWYINNNTCCITLMERQLKSRIYEKPIPMDDCISYRIIAPIYDFKKNNIDRSRMIYFITGSLWGCTMAKLFWKYYKKK